MLSRLTAILMLALQGLSAPSSEAQAVQTDMTRDNLMVVVRESMGANRQDDAFKPTGSVKAKLPDGKEIEFEMASWEFIGDTHIRFVFDSPQTMRNAPPRLGQARNPVR